MSDIRTKIQDEAVQAWIDCGGKGSMAITTGVGKSIISLRCALTLPKGSHILFLAETSQREKDINSDIIKVKDLFNVDIKKDYTFEFMCYQSAYKLKDKFYNIVIADEIHDALTPSYAQFFFNNTYDYIVGLSATIDRSTSYEVDGKEFNKGDLIDKIAPVCFKYTIDQGQLDGTSRKLNMHVIYHDLDAINKTITAGSKLKPFQTTERAAYDYWDKEFKKSLFLPDKIKAFKLQSTAAARAKILYTLPSKVAIVNKLLTAINGKTILFANSLEFLLKITKDTVNSKYSAIKNDKIRNDFDKGKIKLIGSFKMLLQGANLKELSNVILASYFSKEKQLLQQAGRLRVDGDKEGNVFIIVTKGTAEEKWFSKMMEDINNINVRYYSNVDEYIKFINNEKSN